MEIAVVTDAFGIKRSCPWSELKASVGGQRAGLLLWQNGYFIPFDYLLKVERVLV